tara:strand:+ start:60 stop:332 length:273 start_codon:yes stop_codon:yes gene_type:complete
MKSLKKINSNLFYDYDSYFKIKNFICTFRELIFGKEPIDFDNEIKILHALKKKKKKIFKSEYDDDFYAYVDIMIDMEIKKMFKYKNKLCK